MVSALRSCHKAPTETQLLVLTGAPASNATTGLPVVTSNIQGVNVVMPTAYIHTPRISVKFFKTSRISILEDL